MIDWINTNIKESMKVVTYIAFLMSHDSNIYYFFIVKNLNNYCLLPVCLLPLPSRFGNNS